MRTYLGEFFSGRQRAFYVRGYFALLLLVGLLCFRDYGVSWDEEVLRSNAMVSAKYIAGMVAPAWTARQPKFATVHAIEGNRDNDHGVLFELPVVVLAKVLGVNDSRDYYLLRHLAVFLVFAGGVWALYRLGSRYLRSWRWGLLVSFGLVLSPRFFAESFYNGTDIVFLALFTLGAYTLTRLLRRPSLARAAVHGLATAAAVDVRILGVLLVALTVGMLLLESGFGATGRPRRWLLARALAVYLTVLPVAVVAGWPYLWAAPVQHFGDALLRFSRYTAWDGHMLYLGRIIAARQLPWHYAPVWIFVTTPLAYTAAFLLGVGGVLVALLRRPIAHLRTFEGRLDVLILGWFSLPILLVIGLHSVIYDGWRHLYFVYPALLLLAGRGAQLLWHAGRRGVLLRRLAVAAAVVAGLEMAYTAGRMVGAHPQEQVYFSFLPPGTAGRLFECDYWGLSYRQGLEWIARHDSAPVLGVAAPNDGLIEKNLALVRRPDRLRFRLVGAARARYYLSAYRTHPAPYPDSIGREIYRVRAYGLRVLSVFRRPGR
ncbi:ArnT family glycosyltransferase [Hymenobacter terricola]|uniref:ArnT family glycosyltransferase n=1 Tax=Hymenobacter terricola TaxID=2819236 RepID=UPI001B305690|nr:hypothetical protein [Hymenobacter terricola]